MLLVAPLPNQRLDLIDFHFEERTSATAHRSFRLRRMPRFTPRSALSIRQRIVAHAVLRRLLHRSFVLVVVHNSTMVVTGNNIEYCEHIWVRDVAADS
jgi:hypothetical protein